jgi:hypothetical protein
VNGEGRLCDLRVLRKLHQPSVIGRELKREDAEWYQLERASSRIPCSILLILSTSQYFHTALDQLKIMSYAIASRSALLSSMWVSDGWLQGQILIGIANQRE